MTPTFAQRWQEAVDARPGAPFLIFEDGDGAVTRWSYAEFNDVVDRVAGSLSARGIGGGDRVHVVLTNSPAFVALWLACVRLGVAIVPSDPRSTARELETHAAIVEPSLLVLGDAAVDPHVDCPVARVSEDDTLLAEWQGLAAPTNPKPDAPAGILFTSGTTSAPKGVLVTQANYAFAGDAMAAAASLTTADRCLVVLPLFHANAQYYSFAAAISTGASVVLMSTFSASRFAEQAARHEATHASVFAAPIRMILMRGRPVDGLALRHCWYAQNVQPEQLDEFAVLVGCRPRQLYGMTETLAAVTSQRALDDEDGVIGSVTVGCDVGLRTPDADSPVGVGEVGEITVGGMRGKTLFGGYWRAPEATEASFIAGRFRTGDLASMDARGRLRFHGRRGDVLKVGGENVSTTEVEAVLDGHPGVGEVAVVGRPDPVRDEVPVAFVVRAAGHSQLDAAELVAYAEARLAPSKRPREVIFLDELPRTSVGKIRKFMLPSLDQASGQPSG